MIRRPRRSTLFPYTTLSRSRISGSDPARLEVPERAGQIVTHFGAGRKVVHVAFDHGFLDTGPGARKPWSKADRKSTRLNSSHDQISYAVFCLKKKKRAQQHY